MECLDTECLRPASVDLEFGKPVNNGGRREIETKFNTNTHPIHLKHTETVLKKSHTQHVGFVPSQYDNTHVDLKEKGRVGGLFGNHYL